MKKNLLLSLSIISTLFFSTYFISCSKPNVDPTPAVVTCADKTLAITGTVTASGAGASNNGSIAATATGSTGFTFSIGTGAFQASGTFGSLTAGTYTITAKDDAGCTTSKSFTVTAAPCPTVTITAVMTQATNTATANGALNATATGSTGFTYSIAGGAFQASGNFTGLVVNTYQITARDVNGCTTTTGFSVTAASCPTITIINNITQSAGPTATNGAISATASGGLAPYTFSLGGAAFQPTGVFSNLTAGNYSIVAKDVNGCTSAATPVVVTSAACPTITIATVIAGAEFCAPTAVGSITINASGSTGLMYSLNTGAYQSSNVFTGLNASTNTVSVRDANGCVNTSPANVSTLPQGPLFTSVKNLLAANCTSCHGGANPQSGINFTDNCTIVSKAGRINTRAVVEGTMPQGGPLSGADKLKITNWINAGAKFSN